MAVKTEKELSEAQRALWLKAMAAMELRNFDYAISLLQSILKDFADPNLDPGPVDGNFGPQTEMAVKNFQTLVSISPANGVVDSKTWMYLWS